MNIVYLTDCMDFMADKPDNYYDLAIVDPPYGIERFKKCSKKDISGATTKASKRIAERFQGMETVNNEKPQPEYFDELFRTSVNQIIWGANNFSLPPSEYFLCWNKEQAMPNFATLEYAWVGGELKKPAKLFTYSIHKHNQTIKIHPTQKPIALYKWLLKNYAKPGQTILDTHVGSGSIRIACHDLGFDFEGCEIDADYWQAQEDRYNTHIQQGGLFEKGEIQELIYTGKNK